MVNANVQITPDQVNKCLFNGNYKLGKLCGGWHSVANVKARNIDLPNNLPTNVKAFLYFNGNVVFYTDTERQGYYNTGANGKLSQIQTAALAQIQTVAKAQGVKVSNVDLGWVSVGGGKGLDLTAKVASLF